MVHFLVIRISVTISNYVVILNSYTCEESSKNQIVYMFYDEGSNVDEARVTKCNIMTKQG